jgi:hypothetical protein
VKNGKRRRWCVGNAPYRANCSSKEFKMGFSLSWVAVNGKSAAKVQEELGLKGTGQYEEIFESPYTGFLLPKGFYLVVANESEELATEKVLKSLSAGCEAIACFVEEHVMVSQVALWKNGQMVWSVAHDSQKGIEHLDTCGVPPAEFASVCSQKMAAQKASGGSKAEADHVFDVPVDLAEQITGYRYDKDVPGLGEAPYEVLEKRKAKPWIMRVFGR